MVQSLLKIVWQFLIILVKVKDTHNPYLNNRMFRYIFLPY